MNDTAQLRYVRAIILSLLALGSQALMAAGIHEKDSIIIELANKNKIILYSEAGIDLEELKKYDINKMIHDLSLKAGDSIEYIEITSQQGQSYLKDNNSCNEQVAINLGNLALEIDPQEIEALDEEGWDNRTKTTEIVERAEKTTNHFNIDLGLNNWLERGKFPAANSPYAVKPWGSWYIAINSVNRTWVSGPLFLEWGGGISWYSWKLENPDYRIINGDERVEFILNPEENGLKSKLTTSYMNIHLVPMFDLSQGRKKLTSIESQGIKIKKYGRRGFRIGIGAYAGYRLGSHTKFKFARPGSSTERESERGSFYLENFRYGVRSQIGWKGIEFFMNYDLNEVFSAGRGPEGSPGLNAISFGLTL